uniref:LysM domain-containing protein n=1 Tax=Fusarium oxysporum (strain Fo5176) TaxID=660025 RepID=A0A0D2XP64_FUSOF
MKLSKRLAVFWALNLSPLPSVLAASTCSQLSGSIYTGYNGNEFDILCDTSTVNGNIFAYYSEGEQFQDCVDRCDVVPICIVAFNRIRDTIHDPIHRQPQFLHYNQSTIRGFHFCSLSYFNYFITIFFDDDTKPGFYINISPKLCYKPSSQVASSSGSSSSDTTEVGSKTLSTSGATIIKTTSESHLPTSYGTTDSVWAVYLTLIKYVTCTTGVVAETVTTATYVTVDSNGGSYGPPVVTTPDGCIGGYQATLHLAMRPASFIFLRQLQNHKEALNQNKAMSSLLFQVKAHQSPTMASLNQHKVMLARQLSPHTNLVP